MSTVSSHAEDKIHSIRILVTLSADGSADIRQTWDVSSDSGTEYFIPMMNLGGMWIEDLRVKDESGREFERIKQWDTDRSLEEKAYTCGVLEKGNDREICWGKGPHGRHQYEIRYKLINLVQAYPDADGFVSRFVNQGMNLPVDEASIKIVYGKEGQRKSFHSANTTFWTFGHAGTATIENGVFEAKTTKGIDSSGHMTFMMRFEKGFFSPAVNGQGTFAERMKKALEGSSYQKSFIREVLYFFRIIFLRLGIRLLIPLTIGLFLFAKRKYEAPLLRQFKRAGGSFKEAEYCRMVPFRGFIDQAAFALLNGGEMVSRKDLMGAYILRMVKEGALVLKKEVDSDFFGGDRERVSFQVNRHSMIEDPCTSELFDLIISAAGRDNILQPGELRSWAMRNVEKIDFWFGTVDIRGEKGFRFKEGYYINRLSTFFGKTKGYVLTERGMEMILQTLGFKKYLQDFTLIAERETKEIELWDDYLVFAALFGIADRVAEEMKTIYPRFVDVSRLYNLEVDLLSTIYLAKTMNEAIQAGYLASSAVRRSQMNGGSGSIGGGGGFSGGGIGGGVR